MAQALSPILHSVAIADLRPTQMTVGMHEVRRKQKEWRTLADGKRAEFLGRHMVPIVRGPKDRAYIIDHHHLARALHEEGVKDILISAVADLRKLDKDAFWTFLDNRGWMHPFDDNGKRQTRNELPKTVADLDDDPYRSLAGELRFAGGFAKDTAPFSEFLWADALRRRVPRKIAENDFDEGLRLALEFAKSADASFLPGWCGPHAHD
ncbi:chromosome partitioning protein ParB [Hyphomicrobium methylovorum]|uniref:ParB-like protein n=1 Tax=Hyphomicrobium methylovorum TaxID=84 RepID=UPI0015E73E74|nr:ParB-like protein [Hyphomicrobium methylovorum]MBA2124979.1 chromosome partitioning protein ParB [Hyphomicrobium methylovorum]